MNILTLLFPFLVHAQSFPKTFLCTSLIDKKIDQQVVQLNEYAMAQISFQKNDWSYTADVIENRLNSLILENTKASSKASIHSIDSSVLHFHVRLDISNSYATVDCELKY